MPVATYAVVALLVHSNRFKIRPTFRRSGRDTVSSRDLKTEVDGEPRGPLTVSGHIERIERASGRRELVARATNVAERGGELRQIKTRSRSLERRPDSQEDVERLLKRAARLL